MAGNWHTAMFVTAFALAVAVVGSRPDPKPAAMPPGEGHEDRWAYQRCPQCHPEKSLPQTHSFGGDMDPAYEKCYLCHR